MPSPPIRWLSRSRTSYSVHGVGLARSADVTPFTFSAATAVARSKRSIGSIFSASLVLTSVVVSSHPDEHAGSWSALPAEGIGESAQVLASELDAEGRHLRLRHRREPEGGSGGMGDDVGEGDR